MIDLSFAIADKIAGILEERGMSQKDFARLVGKTETEVSRWLEKSSPKFEHCQEAWGEFLYCKDK